MFRQSFLTLKHAICSALICLALSSFSPTELNAAPSSPSYVYDEEFLDHYRMHILGAYSIFYAPNAKRDAYCVFTTIALDNGLEFIVESKPYQHIESAIDKLESMSWFFSYDGWCGPGTEVFLGARPSFITDVNKEFELLFDLFFWDDVYIDIDDFSNESVYETFPKIVTIDIGASEVELSDGSVWRYTSQSISKWKIDARILISITEDGPRFINVDQKNRFGRKVKGELVKVEFLGVAVSNSKEQ